MDILTRLSACAECKQAPLAPLLTDAAAEIERLHTALVAITDVPPDTVLTAHRMRLIAKNAIAT